MPQRCTVCAHNKTQEIEKEIVSGKANTRIADRYGLDHQAIRYHKLNHLPEKLVRHVDQKEREHTKDLFANIQDAIDEANDILREAREKNQNRLSLDSLKVILSANELVGKMMVKMKEFESSNDQKKDALIEHQFSKGLQALSDNELEAFVQLQAKIYAANPEYELSPPIRMFVESVSRMGSYEVEQREGEFGSSNQQDSGSSDSPRIGPRQDKNTQKQGPSDDFDLELDDWDEDDEDWDLDDVDVNTSNQIPSDESDPDWMRERRRKYGTGPLG